MLPHLGVQFCSIIAREQIAAMPQCGFDAHLPVNKGCPGVQDGVVVQQLDVCSTAPQACQCNSEYDAQMLSMPVI